MRRLVILVAVATVAASASASSASSESSGVTIKAKEAFKLVPNKYIQDGVHFAPGTVRVASGSTLTFAFADKHAMEPHTLTIVNRSDLPHTAPQAFSCKACQKYASPHVKHPKAPPGQNNPIVHWTLNTAQPGLDAVGDSIAIQEPGAHQKISIKVSAPAGTTLYFVCAVHPWMQGKIVVT